MWTLNSSDLPNTAITNTDSAIALEVFELQNNGNAPLFTSNILAASNLESTNSTPPAGQIPVTDTETILEPETVAYLYVFEGELSITGLDKVNSINLLNINKYTYFEGNNSTYVLTDSETSAISTTQVISTLVPPLDSSFSFELEIGTFDSVTKVISRGLTLDFTYSNDTLVVSSSANCHPTENEELLIYVENEQSLIQNEGILTYIFDYSTFDISYVSYLTYLGKAYYLSSNLNSGTLLNNYFEKKVLVFE